MRPELEYEAVVYPSSDSSLFRAESNVSWVGSRGNWPVFGAGDTVGESLADLEESITHMCGMRGTPSRIIYRLDTPCSVPKVFT